MHALFRLYRIYLGEDLGKIYDEVRNKQGYFMAHKEMYERDLIHAMKFIFRFYEGTILFLVTILVLLGFLG